MADDPLTPQQVFELERYAEALNTLATALSSLVSDELITVPEARSILVRAGVPTIEAVNEQQQA
jgi:hypothetical protein